MKNHKFLLIAIISMFVIIVFVSQVNSAEKKTSFSSETNILPDSVKKVVEKSCYACHSNTSSNGFAKKALNFEKWDTYKIADQESYKKKICDKVTGNKMPPSGYVKNNPQIQLTEKDKKTLCDWVKSK